MSYSQKLLSIIAGASLGLAAAATENWTSSDAIFPMNQKIELPSAKVALGRRLFLDVRLSHDDTISCATCHDLDSNGADSHQYSTGIGGAKGDINTPTVFNSGFSFRQFWDGRAETLEAQVEGPTHHPKEMGSNWNEIVDKIKKDSRYVSDFATLYTKGVTSSAIRDAIATFERSLITPNSRFDRYLRGEQTVLTELELGGYSDFKSFGCITCHQGMNIGGNLFQLFGVMDDYFAHRGNLTKVDLGRFNVTNDPDDKHKFKVPSLRNVATTAPYFHDGTAATLEIAVETMGRYQLGRELSPTEIRRIVAFLRTLTGEIAGKPVRTRSESKP